MKKTPEKGTPATSGLFKSPSIDSFRNIRFLFSKFTRALSSDASLVDLFDCQTPTVLKVADKPPLLGGKIMEIPTAEFCASEGVTWTESVMGPETLKSIIRTEFISDPPSAEELAIADRLKHPLDLVICSIDPTVGKGVFLSPNSSVIKKGEIVVIYAGKLSDSGKRADDPDFDPYDVETCESELFAMENDLDFPKKGHISGLTHRNIASYIQDGPLKEESEMTLFHKSVKDKLALANLEIRVGNYRGCPVTYLVAIADLHPNQQLLFPYSNRTFWPAAKKFLKIERRYFTLDGALIDQRLHDKRIIPYFHEDGRVIKFTGYIIKAYIKKNEALKNPVALSVPELIELLGYDPRTTEKAVSMSLGEHTTVTLRLAIDQEIKRAHAFSDNLTYDFLIALDEKVKNSKSIKEVSDTIIFAFSAKNPAYVKLAESLKPLKDNVERILTNHNREAQKIKKEAFVKSSRPSHKPI